MREGDSSPKLLLQEGNTGLAEMDSEPKKSKGWFGSHVGGTRAPLTSNCAAHPQLWQEQAPSFPVICRAGPCSFPHRCVHQQGSAGPAVAVGSEMSRAERTSGTDTPFSSTSPA